MSSMKYEKSTSDCLGVYRLVFLMSWKQVWQATTLDEQMSKLETLKFKVSGEKEILQNDLHEMFGVFCEPYAYTYPSSITNIATPQGTAW